MLTSQCDINLVSKVNTQLVWDDMEHDPVEYCANQAKWPWPSFKCHKGHRKVNIECIQDGDMEDVPEECRNAASGL